VIVLLGGEAGLRCGEMIGLQWYDVDLVKTAAPRRAVGMARAHPCAEGRPRALRASEDSPCKGMA